MQLKPSCLLFDSFISDGAVIYNPLNLSAEVLAYMLIIIA